MLALPEDNIYNASRSCFINDYIASKCIDSSNAKWRRKQRRALSQYREV